MHNCSCSNSRVVLLKEHILAPGGSKACERPPCLHACARAQRLMFFSSVVERMGSLVRVVLEIIKASKHYGASNWDSFI